ncbi:PaaI family thioesterase [Nocardia sp. alder85J]|uniref:PaaI family thioesterase n=1 Tax=Nocardia sp. alder85J TaxID=2862949 RepID=UPI001CD4B2B9|nr:hypothetical protein [Nocardia sp. alder85J]MCX4096779.1 hypothetical protein [Nocardia sp. alder85J]
MVHEDGNGTVAARDEPGDGLRFGERPLTQTRDAAGALRRLSGLLLSLEHEHPVVGQFLDRAAQWEQALRTAAPPDGRPRLGDDGPERRVYLDHAADIGAFNPAFPEYEFDTLDAGSATGRVCFPVNYEGPPGSVHGGFLAVFFDCVVQHHNCVAGRAGRTRSLHLAYRRPTPILVELRFDITRTLGERGVDSAARLTLHDEQLCSATTSTVALPPERLTGARYGARRPISTAGPETSA